MPGPPRSTQQDPSTSLRAGEPRRLSLRGFAVLYAHFLQLLINFQDLNFVPQPRPAAQQFGVFLGGAARLLGVPVTKQHVVRIAAAVEEIAAVPFFQDDSVQLTDGSKRSGLHAGQRLPDREG